MRLALNLDQKPYKPQAIHNGESFDKILYCLYANKGVATIDQLADACHSHDHPQGGPGFIKHLHSRGVLVEIL